jgi:hypothetical protein
MAGLPFGVCAWRGRALARFRASIPDDSGPWDTAARHQDRRKLATPSIAVTRAGRRWSQQRSPRAHERNTLQQPLVQCHAIH